MPLAQLETKGHHPAVRVDVIGKPSVNLLVDLIGESSKKLEVECRFCPRRERGDTVTLEKEFK